MFMQGALEGGSIGINIGGGKGEALPFLPDDSCGDDIFEGANADLRSPQLPYLTQDLWGCEREPTDVPAYALEDEHLKVIVTPQWAGKVWTIFDKARGKDVLFNNRAHQPANIGALKAWAAGGAEWNWSPGIIGHSAFSESKTYLSKVQTKHGETLRVYEYDRYNGTVWQVDMYIANGTFFAHPKITNPTEKDLRGYWWTCVAVPATPGTRILTPAKHVAETSRGGGQLGTRDAPWPSFADAIENASFAGYQPSGNFMKDMSYMGNHQIGDMFLRINEDDVYSPYIGHTETDDKTGYTLIHGHPLNGTKFFTWGQSGPGRFMQDFLAGGGKRQGDYTELQVGPAPTQMQTFPVPSKSVTEWTEWFRGFNGDTKALHSSKYDDALLEVDAWMRSQDGMPKALLSNVDELLKHTSTRAADEVLEMGSGWGALEEMRLGRPLAPGLSFSLPDPNSFHGQEIQPWLELLRDGKFSDATAATLPISYQTTDAWLSLIETAAQTHGMSWLYALHLGTNYMERGEIERPMALFKQSAELACNALAWRNIALLQTDPTAAWQFFQKAIQSATLGPFNGDSSSERLSRNLAAEVSFFLQQNEWWNELEWFLDQPIALANTDLDAIITAHVKVLLQKGSQDSLGEARTLLEKHCFPTYASARDDLMSMWNSVVEGQSALSKGKDLSSAERHQARLKDPIPDNIGCQYASEYCFNYW